MAGRIERGWAVGSLLWIVCALTALYVYWDDIYPVQPSYVIAPTQARDKLAAWYSTDENAPLDAFKRDHAIAGAQEVPIGRNVLLLPDDLSPTQSLDFTARARTMEQTLLHRFYRGVAMRFFPLLVIMVLGPPVLLLFLGRGLRAFLTRWVG